MAARDTDDQGQAPRRMQVLDQSVGTSEPDIAAVGSNGGSYPADTPAAQVVGRGNAARPAERSTVASEVVTVDRVAGRRVELDRVSQVIWFVAGVLEVALAFRIAFGLLEANVNAGFVRFITALTDPFVRPFDGIFRNPSASGGATLDSGALLAMFAYLLLAWAIVRLVWIVFERRETGVRRTVRDEHTNVS